MISSFVRALISARRVQKKRNQLQTGAPGRFVLEVVWSKYSDAQRGQQFAPFQGLLESGIAVGYVFLPGAQFVACSSPHSRFEPAVRTPGGPVARHPQPRGRKPVLRREIPWILRGFQGRLSC